MATNMAFASLFTPTPIAQLNRSSFCAANHIRNPVSVLARPAKAVNCITANAVSLAAPVTAIELVDILLQKVKGTNGGLSVDRQKRKEIDGIIAQLSELGKKQQPLTDPKLFSNYSVAYQSQSSSQKSVPAGGKYRSKIGRRLFIARGAFQHIISPNVVINLICFRLLGILKGAVALRGRLEAINYPELGPTALQVYFEPPRLRYGGAVFEFGRGSRVRIATTYLDDRIRIGMGGAGSLFLFTKGGEAETDMAEEWKSIWASKPVPAIVIPVAICGIIGVLFLKSWLLFSIACVLGLLISYVMSRGGIEGNNVNSSQSKGR